MDKIKERTGCTVKGYRLCVYANSGLGRHDEVRNPQQPEDSDVNRNNITIIE